MKPLDPPNPFYERGAVRDPARFFGRRAEMDSIFARLRNGQSVSLVGERRIGKSSLLYQLALRSGEVLGSDVRSIYTDLPDITDEAGFFHRLCRELGVEGSRFQDLERAVGGRPVVACLDEFEMVVSQPGFSLGFFNSLRSLAGSGNLALVLATQHSLADLCRNARISTSPFWNIFSRTDLGLLTDEEARQVITSGFKDAGLAITGEEVDSVISLAGRFPCFLQMASYHVFEMKSGRAPDWEPAFQGEAGDHLVYLWDHLTSDQRSALRWLLGFPGRLPHDDLLRRLERRGLVVPDPQRPHGLGVFSHAFYRYVANPPPPPRHRVWWRRALSWISGGRLGVGPAGPSAGIEFRRPGDNR